MIAPRRISYASKHRVRSIYPEYATVDPVNCDGSRLLLVHFDHFALYDRDGRFIRDLRLGASSRPRWLPDNPKSAYFVSGNELRICDPDTSYEGLIERFQNYQSIDTKGEGRTVWHLIALVGIGMDGRMRAPFVYDAENRTVRLIKADPRPVESLYLTPSGNLLVAWVRPEGAARPPMELFDGSGNLVKFSKPLPPNGHRDVVLIDGEDYLIYCNSDDPAAEGECHNGIEKINLSTGERTCLLALPWALAYHISCYGGDGYAVVSLYGDSQHEYAGKIIRLPLAGGAPEIICEHGASAHNDTTQPKAVACRGGRILFASDMAEGGNGVMDTYMVELGEDASIEPPPPPPPIETTKAELLQDLQQLVEKHGGGSKN